MSRPISRHGWAGPAQVRLDELGHTNAPVADVFVVFATLDEAKGWAGLSAFVIDAANAGVSVGKPFEKMGLRTSPMSELHFDDCRVASDALLEYPLVYLTGHLPLRFSEAERRNVRRLVERGGMLFVDDHNHDVGGVFHNTAFEEIARTFSPLQDLPNDNEIYRSFFQFADGPPTTSHELNGWGDNLVHKNLQAVMQGNRIAVLYSSKDYSSEWNYHPDSKRFQSVDNTRFAVNLIVYALTA